MYAQLLILVQHLHCVPEKKHVTKFSIL